MLFNPFFTFLVVHLFKRRLKIIQTLWAWSIAAAANTLKLTGPNYPAAC